MFPLEHFSLQLRYAERAAAISGAPLETALLEYTAYWARVNDPVHLHATWLRWSFDPTTPDWRELCARIGAGEAADAVAAELYERYNREDGTPPAGTFGCFRFDVLDEYRGDRGVIRIHFDNRDASGCGPLSHARRDERLRELTSMFTAITAEHPEATVVRGGSWLYNIEAYRRLFPESFVASAVAEEVPFPRTAGVWGQFLNSEGEVKDDLAAAFLDRMRRARTIDELLGCFAFRILHTRAGIDDFARFLGIPRPN